MDLSDRVGHAERVEVPPERAMRYWEDYEIGEAFDYGGVTIEEDEMLAFSRRFDPQPYHVDETLARESIHGELIASGLHTASLFVRMFVDGFPDMAIEGAAGWDDLRWRRPVRARDRLEVHSVCSAKRRLRSRDDIAIVSLETTIRNQDGTVVMSMTCHMLVRRRAAGGTG